MNRRQRRRAGRVERDAGSLQVQQIGKSSGDHAVRRAGGGIRIDARAVGGLHPEIVAALAVDPDEDARAAAGEPLHRLPRILERLPRHFQQQPLLRIDADASRGEMPKNSLSKLSMESRNPA
jgi:hypothetical protein